MNLLLQQCTLPGHAGPVDIAISGGTIDAIAERIEPASGAEVIDAAGGLVTVPFVDPHFHLDKTLSRAALGANSAQEAFDRAREVKVAFTVEDVEARAVATLERAVAHGTGVMRAQCDVDSFTGLVSFEGVMRAKERFRDLIDVEVVAFPQEGVVCDPPTLALLDQALRSGASVVGGLPEFEASVEDQREHIEAIFALAEQHDRPIDMHIDYMDDPALKTLEMLADITIEHGYEGRVNADHCCALAVYPDDEAKRVIDKLLTAGIRIAVLPMANLQMLGGPKRTPCNRGSSRIAELLDAGVPVAAGSDNMDDIWYRFNRMDPVQTAFMAVHSGGLRTDDEVLAGFEMTNLRGYDVLGRPRPTIAAGEPASLVLFDRASVADVLRSEQGRRLSIREGRIVGRLEGTRWAADAAAHAA